MVHGTLVCVDILQIFLKKPMAAQLLSQPIPNHKLNRKKYLQGSQCDVIFIYGNDKDGSIILMQFQGIFLLIIILSYQDVKGN